MDSNAVLSGSFLTRFGVICYFHLEGGWLRQWISQIVINWLP